MTFHSDLCPCEQEVAESLMEGRDVPRETAEAMAPYGVDRHCGQCPKVIDKPAGWLSP